MKIVFICGSLEPGLDGVGDYTRRLAIELIKLGHQVVAVALKDSYITVVVSDLQYLDYVDLPVLRLPSVMSREKRLEVAKKWIDKIDPEWLSLQFVPFSFHPKGLILGLDKMLKMLGYGRKWHIMFHELWVNIGVEASISSIGLGLAQREIMKVMISNLQPKRIHTHLPLYRTKLNNIGWNSISLPLFSNIPVYTKPDNSEFDNVFRIGVFSQADINLVTLEFIQGLLKQTMCTGRTVEFLLIGDIHKLRSFGNAVENLKGFNGKLKYTGFLEPKELSWALQSCVLGLTPVPRHALGKSGSVAAFIAHGVPVAAPNFCNSYSLDNIGFFSSFLRLAIVLQPDLSQIEKAKSTMLFSKSEILSSTIAKKFISDLNLRSHSN